MNSAATRIISGVVAGMVAATAAATGVGFWLSYAGLHDFALRSGLSGPEAWAWPAAVDLFIAAGEAGVTISALRHQRDIESWVLVGIGSAASVSANVLHVTVHVFWWTHYVAAAVPPVAAMLALAALLRQVYRLAGPAAGVPVRVAEPARQAKAAVSPKWHAKALRLVAADRAIAADALAQKCNVSKRTAQRFLAKVSKSEPTALHAVTDAAAS